MKTRRKTTAYVNVDVEVDIGEFDDEVLLEEIGARKIGVNEDTKDLITKIWYLRRTGKNYDHLVDELIYKSIGKII